MFHLILQYTVGAVAACKTRRTQFPGSENQNRIKKLTNLCNFSKYNKQDRYKI